MAWPAIVAGVSLGAPVLFSVINRFKQWEKEQQEKIPGVTTPAPTSTPMPTTPTPTNLPVYETPKGNVFMNAIKNTMVPSQGTAPTPIVKPRVLGESVKAKLPPSELVYGRSPKARAESMAHPTEYQQFIQMLDRSYPGEPKAIKDLASDVAAQESSYIPTLTAVVKPGDPPSTSKGLYMFNDGTWGDYLRDSGVVGVGRTDPQAQLDAFMYAIKKGITKQGISRWNASRPIWGPHYTEEELGQLVR